MEQLLSIKTVPISVEVTITPAQLKRNVETPKVEVSRKQGELRMQAEPLKVNIDTFEMRQSTGSVPSATANSIAQDGIKFAYQGLARFVGEDGKLEDVTPGALTSNVTSSQAANTQTVESVLNSLPRAGADVSWDGGTLNVQYQADVFDWDFSNPLTFEFIPASIEFVIKQMPHVDIEYIGGPIYVPPSSDPNYKQPQYLDVKG